MALILFPLSSHRWVHSNPYCGIPQPVFLQSLVLRSMLLLGNMGVPWHVCHRSDCVCREETSVCGGRGIRLQRLRFRWPCGLRNATMGTELERWLRDLVTEIHAMAAWFRIGPLTFEGGGGVEVLNIFPPLINNANTVEKRYIIQFSFLLWVLQDLTSLPPHPPPPFVPQHKHTHTHTRTPTHLSDVGSLDKTAQYEELYFSMHGWSGKNSKKGGINVYRNPLNPDEGLKFLPEFLHPALSDKNIGFINSKRNKRSFWNSLVLFPLMKANEGWRPAEVLEILNIFM